MTKVLTWTVLAVFSIAGCKEKDKPAAQAGASSGSAVVAAPAPTAPAAARKPVATPAAAPRLTIQPAKMDLVRSGLKELQLDADGNVKVGDKTLVKLSPDGKLTKPDGAPIAEIAEDGTVVFAEPSGMGVVEIDENGGVKIDGDEFLRIDADGSVWKRTGDGKVDNDGLAVFEGPPETRRALALVMVVMSAGKPMAPPPPTARGGGPR